MYLLYHIYVRTLVGLQLFACVGEFVYIGGNLETVLRRELALWGTTTHK